MIWREKRWLLITLSVLFLANVLYFFTYRIRYQARVDELQDSLDQARQQLTQAQHKRGRAEASLAAFNKIDEHIQTIYTDRWSTPRQRLTDLLIEVERLERRSQLVPRATSFAQVTEEKDFGATSMSLVFSVQGTYAQIRQLINLLELSPHFIIIDEVLLSDTSTTSGQALTMNLRLKTLFHEPSEVKKPTPPRSS